MRVEYSKRAVSEIRQIAGYYDRSGNPAAAKRVAVHIQEVATQISGSPLSGRLVVQRPGVLVVVLANYRYKILYRIAGDTEVEFEPFQPTIRGRNRSNSSCGPRVPVSSAGEAPCAILIKLL
jgi:toxin ParE1/3/4